MVGGAAGPWVPSRTRIRRSPLLGGTHDLQHRRGGVRAAGVLHAGGQRDRDRERAGRLRGHRDRARPTPGGPGTPSIISANTPAAGSATVTIGSGQATLTFTTSSTSGVSPAQVPNVFGFGLTAAKAAVRKAHCSVGAVRKVYSNIFYPGSVYSQSPQRGTVNRRPVNLTGQPRPSPLTLRSADRRSRPRRARGRRAAALSGSLACRVGK